MESRQDQQMNPHQQMKRRIWSLSLLTSGFSSSTAPQVSSAARATHLYAAQLTRVYLSSTVRALAHAKLATVQEEGCAQARGALRASF